MNGGSHHPTTEAGQIVWLANYPFKIPIHCPACGIGPEAIPGTQQDIRHAIGMLRHCHPAARHDAKEATGRKPPLPDGGTSHPRGCRRIDI